MATPAFDDYVTRVIEQTFERKYVPILYHYTDRVAVEGIIRNKQFWAKPFDGMDDDPDELTHANKLIDAVAASLAKSHRKDAFASKVIKRFQEWHAVDSIGKAAGLAIWIGCFCEDRDAPKLWEKFGRKCSGMCLGIERTGDTYPVTDGVTAVVAKVEYNPKIVRATLMKAFEKVLRKAGEQSTSEIAERAASAMMRIAAIRNITHKPQQLQFEREWRLILMHEGREKARDILKWYLRPDQQPPAIASVDVGSVCGEEGLRFVHELFTGCGYGSGDMPKLPEIALSKCKPSEECAG